MNAIDQLVRELQDRKPQWSSVDGAMSSHRSPRKQGQSRSASRPSHREWMRTVVLSGVFVAGLIALQNDRTQPSPTLEGSSATLATQPTPPKPLPRVISNWQMDWQLSLDKLRLPVQPLPAPQARSVALSPNQDLSQDTEATAGSADEPDRLASALAQGSGPLMIAPPAAGRAQTLAHQVQTQYRRAMDLLEQGRETAALDLLSQVLALDPHHLAARRLAITVAADHQQATQAQAWVDEGVKLHPDDVDLRTLQARLLSQAGASEEAVSVLQELPHPHAEALGLKAGLLVKLGRHAQAAGAYEEALKAHPHNAAWWLGLGVSCQAQGQKAAAREAFARAWHLGQQGQLGPDVQAWLEQQL